MKDMANYLQIKTFKIWQLDEMDVVKTFETWQANAIMHALALSQRTQKTHLAVEAGSKEDLDLIAQATSKRQHINAQVVQEEIDRIITRSQQRIDALTPQAEESPATNQLIGLLRFGNNTLIELKHNLRLCGCPDEAYYSEKKEDRA
jgi:hypothetical protein